MIFNKNQKPLYIHKLFDSLVNNCIYFITGLDMIMQEEIQKAYLQQKKGYYEIRIVKIKYSKQPLKFSFNDVFQEFNKENKIRKVAPKIVKGEFQETLKKYGIQIAICLFDILQVSTYENCLNKTEIYNFAKHIRNGSAHKNKFTFEEKNIKKLKNSSINWRGKEININLEKKEIFDSFIDATDLILLISDISQMMKKIDEERKRGIKDKQIKKILKTFSMNLI